MIFISLALLMTGLLILYFTSVLSRVLSLLSYALSYSSNVIGFSPLTSVWRAALTVVCDALGYLIGAAALGRAGASGLPRPITGA